MRCHVSSIPAIRGRPSRGARRREDQAERRGRSAGASSGRAASPRRRPPPPVRVRDVDGRPAHARAARSRRCSARLSARAAGATARRAPPDPLGQRRARDEVDHVVLAQIDEGEAQRDRVRPPDRPGTGPPRAAGARP